MRSAGGGARLHVLQWPWGRDRRGGSSADAGPNKTSGEKASAASPEKVADVWVVLEVIRRLRHALTVLRAARVAFVHIPPTEPAKETSAFHL